MTTTYSRKGRRAAAAQDRTERQADCEQRRTSVQQFAHAFRSAHLARAQKDQAARNTMRQDLRNQVSSLCMNMQGLLRDWSKLHVERAEDAQLQRLYDLNAIQTRVNDLLDQAQKTRSEHQASFAAMLSTAHQQRMNTLNQIRQQIAHLLAD